MKVFVQNFIQENDQCLRALLDVDKSQWREMTSILSRGKNDEVEALVQGHTRQSNIAGDLSIS